MAITFKGTIAANTIDGLAVTISTTTALNTTTGGSGGNIAPGDFLITVWSGFNRAAGSGALTDSAARSWNSILDTTSGNNRDRVAWLVATPADVTGVTLTFAATGNAADGSAALCAVFRGVDPSNPISTTLTSASNAASTNPNPPSITPSHNNCAIVIGYGSTVIDAAPGTVTSYSLTQQSAGNDTNDGEVQFGYRILSGGSGTPQDPAAWSAKTSSAWVAFSVALKEFVFAPRQAFDLLPYQRRLSAAVRASGLVRSPWVEPGPAPGSGDVEFASAQATVSYRRTLLYPSLQQPIPFPVAVTHYTLDAAAGSYTVTGTAASLEVGREVAAGGGTYGLTGTAANLEYGREVAAGAGSYLLTGTAVTFDRTYKLTAAAGSYALTGTAANLERGRRLIAGAGAYTVTGTAVTFDRTYRLTADAGTYTLTGTAAELTYEPVGAFILSAADGAYAVIGTAATLKIDRRLVVESGDYTITGTAADLAVSGVQPPEVPSVGGGGVGYLTRRRWRALRRKEEELERERTQVAKKIAARGREKNKLEVALARREQDDTHEARAQQARLIAITQLQVTFVLRMRAIDEELARIRQALALEFERDDEETIELLLLH